MISSCICSLLVPTWIDLFPLIEISFVVFSSSSSRLSTVSLLLFLFFFFFFFSLIFFSFFSALLGVLPALRFLLSSPLLSSALLVLSDLLDLDSFFLFFFSLLLDLSGDVDGELDLDVGADVFVVLDVVEDSLELLLVLRLLQAASRCPTFPHSLHFSSPFLLRSGHFGLM